MLVGKTLEEAKEIKNKDIAEALDLPPIKIHCSVLAEDSIRKQSRITSQSYTMSDNTVTSYTPAEFKGLTESAVEHLHQT